MSDQPDRNTMSGKETILPPDAKPAPPVITISGGQTLVPSGAKGSGQDHDAATAPAAGGTGLQAGDVLMGRFRIEATLGSGGMGQVFKVRDEREGRNAAIKVIRPDLNQEKLKRRLFDEVGLCKILTHPDIVRVHDSHEDTERHLVFYSMDLIEGRTLRNWLDKPGTRGPVCLDDFRRIGRRICDALTYAHGKNVVHRDLKPENVLVTGDLKDIKVVDFGIAQILDPDGHYTQKAGGHTPYYAAPEQVKGAKTDHRADIYSLGIMFCEILTGDVPYAGSPPPSKKRKDMPAKLDEILAKATAEDPNQRWTKVAEFWEAVEQALDEAIVDPGYVPEQTGATDTARLHICTPCLPAAFQSEDYRIQLNAEGGTGHYWWHVEGLPEGLKLVSAEIVGQCRKSGSFPLKLMVTDSQKNFKDRAASLTVLDAGHYRTLHAGTYQVGRRIDECRKPLSEALKKGCCPGLIAASGKVELGPLAVRTTPVSKNDFQEFLRCTHRPLPDEPRRGWLRRQPEVLYALATREEAEAYCRWRGTRLISPVEWDAALEAGLILLTDTGSDVDEWTSAFVPSTWSLVEEVAIGGIDFSCLSDRSGDVVSGDWRPHRRHQGIPTALIWLNGERDDQSNSVRLAFREVADLSSTSPSWMSMVLVSAGTYPVGENKQRAAVSGYEIARHPVSNTEFEEFCIAFGRIWKYEPIDAFLPAVNVSFQDAVNFCRWKTECDRQGYVYHLPTPIEREIAVRGHKGRNYPWGDEYDRHRCNSAESCRGQVVGIFDIPTGRTPEGIAHLCGNVSEWVWTEDGRAAMGGSYQDYCRYWGLPYIRIKVNQDRSPVIGFRYVRRPKGGLNTGR